MARTELYRKGFLNVGDLEEVKLSVKQAREALSLQIQSAQTALSSEFDGKLNNVIAGLNRIEVEVGNIRPGEITATDVTPEALVCIRVLSQVQDLVTDKDFNVAQNNKTLAKLRNAEPYKQASELLKESNLFDAFQQAFRDFDNSDLEELAERFVEIQGLNREIVRDIRSKTPTARG